MGVSHLLDTHVLLWLLGDPAKLPDDVRARLADRSNPLLVSAVSALEVSTEVRLGRLPEAAPLVDTWSTRVREIGATEVPVSTEHALLAGRLAWSHRDPFDRLLVAQALADNTTLVSTDPAMAEVVGLKLTSWSR